MTVNSAHPRAPTRSALLALAFVEGALVIFIEVAGARQLAPYYGSTHIVWTAQITATLLCLAAGYALGGRVSRARAVGPALVFAGLWTALSALLRAPALEITSHLGVAPGAFAAALILYGPALALLGSVGPNLIAGLTKRRKDAGSAAGRVLFVSTLGGIAGGWLTTLVLIPRASLSGSMSGAAILLAAAGLFAWSHTGLQPRRAWLSLAVLVALIAAAPAPRRALQNGEMRAQVISSEHGATGLVQVLDVPAADARFLLVDGTVQGAEQRSTGKAMVEFSDYLLEAGLAFQPRATNALLLGLGAGTLARGSAARGLDTTAIEIDPAVVSAARSHFALPDAVRVVVADARTALRRSDDRFDLIFLDVYCAESFPWHLATREAFLAIRDRLQPGGRLVINAITHASGHSPGLDRLESTALSVFGEAWVFSGDAAPGALRNATIVVGEQLGAVVLSRLPARLRSHFERARPGQQRVAALHDDLSDFDSLDAALRLTWRASLTPGLDPRSLAD